MRITIAALVLLAGCADARPQMDIVLPTYVRHPVEDGLLNTL